MKKAPCWEEAYFYQKRNHEIPFTSVAVEKGLIQGGNKKAPCLEEAMYCYEGLYAV